MYSLVEFKSVFDDHLHSFFDKKFGEYRTQFQDETFFELCESVRSITLGGGKRIRPYLAYLISGKKDISAHIQVLTALELFHVFALIHDDVIDRGAVRHGVPTVHESYYTRKKNKSGRVLEYLAHISEGQAILIGDLVFSWCYQLFDECGLRGPRKDEVKKIFQEMVRDVVVGQIIDVDLLTVNTATTKRIMEKMELKTASYTFVHPMRIGYKLSSSRKNLESFFQSFGHDLGVAFQIQDDVLDITSSAKVIGKTVCSDILAGQHTLYTQYIFDHGSVSDKALLREVFGTGHTNRVAEVQYMLQTSGALEYAVGVSDEYFARARKTLESVDMNDVCKQQLSYLVQYIYARSH